MTHAFETNQWVPHPVELVFAFFANPANLPHLMPPWQRTRIESSRIQAPPARPMAADPELRFQSIAAGMGSEMTISFRPIIAVPLRQRWLARITEFVWFDHFEDVQVRGPFAHWRHRHATKRETRNGQLGTLVMDEVEYELPLGIWGEVAHRAIVRGQMLETFAYRQRRLIEILPTVERQAIRKHRKE